MTAAELTDQQRYDRRKKAAHAITAALRESHHEWHRLNDGDWRLLGDIAMDALGDMAAEILTDGTLLKGLDIRDGVVTLETEPAREILLTLVASMRGMLDGYGAENYLETEITDTGKKPKVELDLHDGQHPADSYTVTIQRRYRPTPHEFRQLAERRITAALAECDVIEAEQHGQHDEDADGMREAVQRIRATLRPELP